jgi:hypothetical protein
MTTLKTSHPTDSRVQNLCDEDGVLPAIEAAMARGELHGYATAQDYLIAVLEGETPDRIDAFGWQPCRHKKACRRRGRCLRQDAPPGPRQSIGR